MLALLSAALAAASTATEPAVPHPGPTPSPVACHRVAMDEYQCFIKNGRKIKTLKPSPNP
jgi:hypothetical protein